MRALRASRWEGETALERMRMPSRWRASRLACRWWEVRVLEESSAGVRFMDVMEEEGTSALRVEAGILRVAGEKGCQF